MKLIEITKEQLNKFTSNQKQAQFLQSWQWSEFQEKTGNKVFRLGWEEAGEIIFAVSLIKKELFAGKSYFYLPRFGTRDSGPGMREFFEGIKELAKKENVVFLRFEPVHELQIKYEFTNLRIVKTIDVQPSKTLILDITKSEEDILKEMHQKTRYNIRLAEKKGVKIREAGEDDFEKFWALMEETKDRDGFRLHGREHYQKMLDSVLRCDSGRGYGIREAGSGLIVKLFLAEYEGRVITANIVAFFGNMVTYVHGASSNQDRNVMAPFLMQWETIKLAKKEGCKFYDFYGIDEIKWPGVTRFKKGFGGQEVIYPGTYDLVFNKFWYKIYKILRSLRKRVAA